MLNSSNHTTQSHATRSSPELPSHRPRLSNAIDSGSATTLAVAEDNTGTRGFQLRFEAVDAFDTWLGAANAEMKRHEGQGDDVKDKTQVEVTRHTRWRAERDKLEKRREVYTVDATIDQVMTAFKLTFMNLCGLLMSRYFDGKRLSLDTLIRAVLTLPGQRVTTRSTETIQIWRQPRDPETMRVVEEACKALTERGLVRDEKRLCFEVVDRSGGEHRG